MLETKEIVSEKRCRICHRLLPFWRFSVRPRNKDGRSCACRDCARPYRKQYYKQKKEVKKKYNETYRSKNKEKCNFLTRKWMYRLRLMALNKIARAYYATSLSCVKCGFSDTRALQIDHINGGGTSELRHMVYCRFLQKILSSPLESIRNNYQILCSNCNMIKKEEMRENYIWRGKHTL